MILFVFHVVIYLLGAIATYELIYHVEMDGDNLPRNRYRHGKLHHEATRDDAAAVAFLGAIWWPLAVLIVLIGRRKNRDHNHR